MDHYYNAYKTVIRMMADRGYTFNKKNNLSDFKLTMPEFEVKFKGINENKLDIKGVYDRSGKKRVYVRFINPETDVLEATAANDLLQLVKVVAESEGISLAGKSKDTDKLSTIFGEVKVIIIYNGVPSAKDGTYKKYKKSNVEVIPVQKLTHCILDSEIMPHKVELIENGTRFHKLLIAKYENKLSKITLDDPLTKYFDAKPNDILRVTRRNMSIVYRRVTNVRAHK